MIVVKVADFTDAPGSEFISMGPKSGELFYKQVLEPAIKRCLETKEPIELHLDGVIGYPHTWIRGAFSPISQIKDEEEWCLVALHMDIVTQDHREHEDEIRSHMWKQLPT